MTDSKGPREVERPSFDSLPLRKDGPHGNAWGLFGENDQVGMLNLLTPETTMAATKEIVHGIRISTDWPLNKLQTPLFGRVAFKQEIHHKRPRTVSDDILTFNTQSSTQWDGFRHHGACSFLYTLDLLYRMLNGENSQDIRTRNSISTVTNKMIFIRPPRSGLTVRPMLVLSFVLS